MDGEVLWLRKILLTKALDAQSEQGNMHLFGRTRGYRTRQPGLLRHPNTLIQPFECPTLSILWKRNGIPINSGTYFTLTTFHWFTVYITAEIPNQMGIAGINPYLRNIWSSQAICLQGPNQIVRLNFRISCLLSTHWRKKIGKSKQGNNLAIFYGRFYWKQYQLTKGSSRDILETNLAA